MIFDLEEMAATSPLPVDDPSLDFGDLSGLDAIPDISIPDVSDTSEITLYAAEKCATILVNFTRRLTPSDFTGFWYSCELLPSQVLSYKGFEVLIFPGSRIGFATVSNFLMLLLVQAPNMAHAMRGKYLVESWLQVLRCQSPSFPLVKLGLARLDALQWGGLADTFMLPPHVQDIATNANASPDLT